MWLYMSISFSQLKSCFRLTLRATRGDVNGCLRHMSLRPINSYLALSSSVCNNLIPDKCVSIDMVVDGLTWVELAWLPFLSLALLRFHWLVQQPYVYFDGWIAWMQPQLQTEQVDQGRYMHLPCQSGGMVGGRGKDVSWLKLGDMAKIECQAMPSPQNFTKSLWA